MLVFKILIKTVWWSTNWRGTNHSFSFRLI